jgi:hypothetical protein
LRGTHILKASFMKVIDINGNELTVTDLNKAIEQANMFQGFKHEDKRFEKFDDQQNRYWSDLYQKLLELKKKDDE